MNLEKTIFLFNVNEKKRSEIINVSKPLGIFVKTVDLKDYNQSLGSISKVQGFKKEKKEYSGNQFIHEMLLFSGIDGKTMDDFLESYKKAKIEPIARKATITLFNIKWTAKELYDNLNTEILNP